MYTKQQIALLDALKDRFGPEVVTVAAQKNSALICESVLTGAALPAKERLKI